MKRPHYLNITCYLACEADTKMEGQHMHSSMFYKTLYYLLLRFQLPTTVSQWSMTHDLRVPSHLVDPLQDWFSSFSFMTFIIACA